MSAPTPLLGDVPEQKSPQIVALELKIAELEAERDELQDENDDLRREVSDYESTIANHECEPPEPDTVSIDIEQRLAELARAQYMTTDEATA